MDNYYLLFLLFYYFILGTTELGGLAAKQHKKSNINSVGIIAKGFMGKIIDPKNNKILGSNEQGEACFKSSFMMTEYYCNLEGTKNAIDEDGWSTIILIL